LVRNHGHIFREITTLDGYSSGSPTEIISLEGKRKIPATGRGKTETTARGREMKKSGEKK